MPSTRRLRIALGTWVAIETRAENASIEEAAIEAAYAAINVVERWMHPHREGSDLARINSAAPHTPLEIHPDTWRVLRLARTVHDLTGGVFDPCLPYRDGRLSDVELGIDGPRVVCRAPVEIDLGGIAKGHAIDRAIELLQEHGCSSGQVNAGGDLRVFGNRDETILLRQIGSNTSATNPGDRRTSEYPDSTHTTYRQLILRNIALAVSDLEATERPAEHQGYYTRANQPPTRRYAAVIAETAATADALTKCVLFCTPEVATRALRELQAQTM